MSKPIIYDNGDIKLKHLINIKFKSKLDNKILSGMVIGQEATQFIIWINPSVTAKVNTQDIIQVEVIVGNKDYFVTLDEYKTMEDNQIKPVV